MSKDIRSFFKLQGGLKKPKTSQSGTKKQMNTTIEDDDVIPESPDIIKTKPDKKTSKKRRIIEDSSDEDIAVKTKIKQAKVDNTKKQQDKSNLKEVSAADIFGGGPIKRTPVPKKLEKSASNIIEEVTIHSDDDFEKTLIQLDESVNNNDKSNGKNERITNSSPKKESPTQKSQYFNSGKAQLETKVGNAVPNSISTYKIPKKAKLESTVPSTEEVSPQKHKPSPKKDKKSPYKDKQHIVKGRKSNKKLGDLDKSDSKQDFSEFLTLGCEEESQVEDTQTPKNKKRKYDKSLNESVVSDEERYEKKRHSAILYQKYLNRSGPKNLGAKEIPEGAPNCLQNLSFVLTGILSSFEREEVTEAIQKYGGTVKSGVSKKVTHVIAGDDAGPAKLAKAEDLGIKILNEDEFLDLIRNESKPRNKESVLHKENVKKKEKDKNIKKEICEVSDKKKVVKETNDNKKIENDKVNIKSEKELESTKGFKAKSFYKNTCSNKTSTLKDEPCSSKDIDIPSTSQVNGDNKSSSSVSSLGSAGTADSSSLMWVDKYKPRTVKQIIGQNGDASVVKKLSNWLTRWYLNRKKKLDKPSPWAKNDDGGYFKCALLSGPPGIGKTTTVSLVCAELGFDLVEFNASDTRSKSLVRGQISELLTTTSLAGFVNKESGQRAVTKKHVLVMDEVDGMAGNEDRGGMQELISLIKLTSVPIVCMCNDRNSQKMRSLVNYCYDLRFTRPRIDQIKSAMMSVCFKEGVKIAPDVLTQLVVSANQDVRQTLNLLSLYAAGGGNVTVKKDVKLGPWEVVRKVFSAEEHKTMSLHDQSDLFFYDYSLAPLFVQENYLQVTPHCDKSDVLRRISRAADSISRGDLVEARIRGSGAWGLLPVQAIFSSVLPGAAMRGHVSGQIQFPGWLGKNSRAGKMQRLAQEIHAHTRLSTSGSKSSIFLDYSAHLRDAVVTPLVREGAAGVPRALAVLAAYRLLREDLDALGELAAWPGKRDPMLLVDSKVKAAMTRAYNKEAATLPHARAPARAARAGAADTLPGLPGDDDDADGESEVESDVDNDAMIKKKKKPTLSNKESSKSEKKGGKGKKGKK